MLLLPVLSFLWANLHGGSLPILFAFIVLFILMCYLPNINTFGLVNENEQKTKKVKTYIQIFVASLLTGLINPYTYKLYYYFFLTNNEATKKYVSEWQPCELADIVASSVWHFCSLSLPRTRKSASRNFCRYFAV